MKNLIKFSLVFCFLLALWACGPTNDVVTSSGEGGSTARFVIQQNHLIAIEDQFIQVYSVENPSSPVLINQYEVTARNLILETIYPYQDNRVLLGTTQGAFIMDHSTPGTLNEIAFAQHSTNCDPVVAKGNHMYVTLRNGRTCDAISDVEGVNQLLVYDITDVGELNDNNELIVPSLVKTIEMDAPWGLSFRDQSLFVCYESGVTEFDITSPDNPQEVGNYDTPCNDIIAGTDPMILTADNEIRLMSKQDNQLTELAVIEKGE